MRRLGLISALFLIILGLTGCGNRTELNELGIISATGLDGEEGNWTATYQVIIPSAMASNAGGSGGGSQSAVHTFSTEGKTIREAIDVSNLENPRKLYFAHNNVLIIGKKAADSGISELVDNYLRNFESRESVKVMVADGEAAELLKQLAPPEKIPGVALVKILAKADQAGSFFPTVTMFEVAQKLSSDSGAVGVPEISKVGSGDEKLDTIEIFQKTSAKQKLKLTGLSVFQGPKRIATLGRYESQGISWLSNQMQSSTMTFEEPGTKKGEKLYTAFQARTVNVKATPVKGPMHYTLDVKVKVKGDILESTSKEDLTKVKGIKKLEQLVNKRIEAQIQDGWESIQKLNVDLVGIADKIHRKYPKDWNKLKGSWPKEMSQMDIKIDVTTNITRPGLFQKSFSNQLETKKKN